MSRKGDRPKRTPTSTPASQVVWSAESLENRIRPAFADVLLGSRLSTPLR